MIWVILVIFAVVAIVYFINSYQNKYQSFQGVVFNSIIVSTLVFFVFTVSFVYIKNKPDLTNFREIIGFFKLYFFWVVNLLNNTGDIAGYVIKQNWIPNSTLVK